MPFTPIVGTVKAEILGRNGITNDAIVNVLHFGYATTPDLNAVQTLANSLLSAWATRVVPSLASPYRLDSVRVTDLATAAGLQFQAIDTTPATGSGNPAPPQVCAVVTLYTAIRSRRARGRIYLSPVQELGLAEDSGLLSATYTANLAAAIGLIQADMAALPQNWDLAVASQLDGVSRTVTSRVVKPMVGTQRRRLR